MTVRIGTLTECPRCGGCCYAVMARLDGSLYMHAHGDWARCDGPSSFELIGLLLVQHGLTDDGGSVGAR